MLCNHSQGNAGGYIPQEPQCHEMEWDVATSWQLRGLRRALERYLDWGCWQAKKKKEGGGVLASKQGVLLMS